MCRSLTEGEVKLYVANPTDKNHEFLFPLMPGKASGRMFIPAGGQSVIPKDLRQEDINAIVEHHLPYGLRPVEGVEKINEQVWLIASIDKPVKADTISRVIARNVVFASAAGESERQQTAMAAAETLENFARAQQFPVRKLETLEVETTEATPTRGDGRGPEPKRFDGANLKVDMNPERAAAAGAGRGRRK